MTTTLPPSGDTPAELAEHLASGARLVEAFHLMPGVARAMREAARLLRKPCTCHPDDNPPVPCPRKYALSECRAAAPPADDEAVRLLREARAMCEDGDGLIDSERLASSIDAYLAKARR